jgi:O-acetyl-ADP-ribose deacetylase (regulator of RNase III)
MIRYVSGNILDADVEALVNTVNTVGVMGKGIALMFKDAFPENSRLYAAACKRGEVAVGRMFVTHREGLIGPRWIINFPTKQHWRGPSHLDWVEEGLKDLRRVISENGMRSVAVPPLGTGAGGLEWRAVRQLIDQALSDLPEVEVVVYQPTSQYHNVARKYGVATLTPARALIAESVRRYSVLGMECSVLEVQKLAWFLERSLSRLGLDNPLNLGFVANKYGPYAKRLTHLLADLDGSYLHCTKRLADATPRDAIWFDDSKTELVAAYLGSGEARRFLPALEQVTGVIEGFESPLGMELLATVDWLLGQEGVEPSLPAIRVALRGWKSSASAAERKLRLFDDRLLGLALERLSPPALAD